MHTGRKRVLATTLALFLLLSGSGVSALAEETPAAAVTTEGCTHHTEHTEECGYVTRGVCSYQCDICSGETGSAGETTEDSGDAAAGTQTGADTVNDAEPNAATGTDTSSDGSADAGEAQNTAQTITSWSWNWTEAGEDLFTWSDENSRYEALLGGGSEEDAITKDMILEYLPKSITAQVTQADGTEAPVELELVWDLSAVPEEGIRSDSYNYTLTATLKDAEQYALGADVRALNAVIMGDEGMQANVSRDVLNQHKIPTASAEDLANVTLNLFDYWTVHETALGGGDDGAEDQSIDDGINANHALLFHTGYSSRGGPEAYAGNSQTATNNKNFAQAYSINYWTGSDNPRSGIVQSKLGVDGFPMLNLGSTRLQNSGVEDRSGSESLNYLFNSTNRTGKKAYSNVQGLLKIDKDGYYAYNSQENFAEFVADGTSGSFNVYDYWAVQPGGGGTDARGQFFPFNNAETLFEFDQSGNSIIANSVASTNSSINHYLGLTLEASFQQPENGKVGVGTTQRDMVYEFSGDDDVWIFIDGVLVADLGGIHNTATTSINFSTGEVKINGAAQTQRLGDILKSNNVTTGVNGDTLATGSVHTLKMFYLERGNVDSNLKLKFNLLAPEFSYIEKVDQDGNPIADIPFTLYESNENKAQGTEVFSGTTEENGQIRLTEPRNSTIPLQLKTDQYYLLKEDTTVSAARGYIAMGDGTGEVLLVYKNGELRVVNEMVNGDILDEQWRTGTGTILSAKVAIGTLYEYAAGDPHGNEITDTSEGIIVAVPILNTTKGEEAGSVNWKPIYGSPEQGYQVANGNTPREEVINAVLRQIDYPGPGYSWYLTKQANGQFEGELQDLPGTINRYRYMASQEGSIVQDLYLSYYWVPGISSPSQITEDVLSGMVLLDDNISRQEYSTRIQVTNLVRELQIIKTDEEGNRIPGAVFGLYESTDPEALPVAEGTTDAAGIVSFSASDTRMGQKARVDGVGHVKYVIEDNNGANKNLYVKEISAPPGYKINETVIPVVVTADSVYVYAGDASDTGNTDGVSVRKGLGKLTNTMLRYAVNGAVDATLRDIKMTGYLNVNETFSSWTANGWTGGSSQPAGTIDLHYGLDNENKYDWGYYGYGVHDVNGVGGVPYIETTYGWLGFATTQDYEAHQDDGDEYSWAYKADLTHTPNGVTNVFTGITAIVVKDTTLNKLTVEKTVESATDASSLEFTFTLTLTAPVGQSLPQQLTVEKTLENGQIDTKTTYDVTANPTNSAVGTVTFRLKDKENITFIDIPENYTCSVSEEANAAYQTSITKSIGSGTTNIVGVASGDFTLTADTTLSYLNADTFNFTFVKVDGAATTTRLSGAEFTLYRLECSDTTNHQHGSNVYSKDSNKDCWKNATVVTSIADGSVTFTNLRNGIYRLVETKAPAGYVLPGGEWQLDFSNGLPKTKDEWGIESGSSKITAITGSALPPAFVISEEGANLQLSLPNYKPGSIPSSGGRGILYFTLLGMMLIAGGGGWMLYRKKTLVRAHRRAVRRHRR